MTQRLYLNDSYITQNEARVIGVEEKDGGYLVELDESVFFPTSGGQPHDTGVLGEAAVLNVIEDGERVLHFVSTRLNVGDRVHAQIDWPRRFDLMQQHSGEHVLSYAAKALYGAANVGFHMAASYSTVDFDRAFDSGELTALEDYANELISRNMPVSLSYVDASELEGMTLRKAAKGLTGTVRIVSMPGGDSCTCCGTHVKNTGDIGSLKITESMHYKGGERITIVCGARALKHAQEMQKIVDLLAKGFSCKAGDIAAAVKKLKDDNSTLKREQRELYTKLIAYIADEYINEAKKAGRTLVIAKVTDLPPSQLKNLGQAIINRERAVALLLSAGADALSYVVCASEPLDAGEFIEPVNAALNGKGGGRKTLAQGSAKPRPGLNETLEQLELYLLKRIK